MIYTQWHLWLDFWISAIGVLILAWQWQEAHQRRHQAEVRESITAAINAMCDGDLNQRLLIRAQNPSQQRVVDSLNMALDQIEMTLKEVNKVFASAVNGRGYRHCLPKNFRGNFARVLARVEESSQRVAESVMRTKRDEIDAEIADLRTKSLLTLLRANQKDLRFVIAELDAVEVETQGVVSTASTGHLTAQATCSDWKAWSRRCCGCKQILGL